MFVLIVVLIIIVLAVLFFIFAYNGVVKLRNRVDQAWSQIGVQLTRRHDLIPNLVETVKGYASHEKNTLEAVVQARNSAVQAQQSSQAGPAAQAQAENVLTGALRQLFAVAEAYPDLKANQNFSQLQEELTSTENRIGFARQNYNNVVENYNTRLQSFPTVMIAGMFGFQQEPFFGVTDAADREPVQVKF